jgi:hypothetical protein
MSLYSLGATAEPRKNPIDHGEYERNRQALQHLVRRWRFRPHLLVVIAKMGTRMGLTGKGAGSEAILDTPENLPIRSQPGDLCWLTLGINTAFRANERLAIKVGEVRQKRSYWSSAIKVWGSRQKNERRSSISLCSPARRKPARAAPV